MNLKNWKTSKEVIRVLMVLKSASEVWFCIQNLKMNQSLEEVNSLY